MQQFLDTKEAAKHVRLSTATLERLRVRGGGPPYITPIPSRVLYDVTDLDAWMWSRRRHSTSETEAA
ncbi:MULTISPECIES: helix-turn-helix domain-containing protein [unclassified Bradyrhizobium]|uniref:helix-turn-helix domain-containing protein n=1 Tax=unclassified Bradyrhizobium TaxID=2631580 RepID=UPI001FFA6099|nr:MULTISPECIES: helix-turn-helix domain-containing protein [unclassified Bradyrhizobium]MCK1343099.1 helix-turn-helix domain-containing protein [Bradyrhizobium sp. CW11]MCK1586453.1 helix-turn-helix domain-containing protein [Bradyrhizobium sp. 169]